MLPSDVRLPFPKWRSGQESLLQRLVLSEKPIILLEAPTGAGKSAVAASVQHWLGLPAIFLTSTKALQDQYAEAIPGMLPAKGRDNFSCDKQPWLTAKQGVCMHGLRCNLVRTPGCAYYAQKMLAQGSDRAVLNYQYWLAQANYTGDFAPVPLLVCDEAHLVEDEIRRFVELEVRKATLSTLRLKPPGRLGIPEWREWAGRNVAQITEKISHLDPQGETYWKARDLEEAVRQLIWITEEHWTLAEEKYRYVFKPVWIEGFAREKLLQHAEKIIFMSATILDADAFCGNLGIDVADTEFIRIGSSFPAARRPLHYRPVGKVSAKTPASFGRVVAEVDRILDVHAGRGLVHTANYKLAQFIAKHSRHRERLITHDTKSRGASIDKLKSTPSAVLVSPSMTTGVDLAYDLCDFQVICKLQFPDMGDPQVEKRRKKKKGDRWYTWITACNLVQAYGRGMRAPDDNCITYLLDGVFGAWFYVAVRDMLPYWFRESIKWPKKGDDPDVSVADQLASVVTAAKASR